MPPASVSCPYKIVATGGAPVCSMVRKITGIADPRIGRTNEETCRACQKSLRHGEPVNPVVASLVYNAMNLIIAEGGSRECGLERARMLRMCAEQQVSIVLGSLPNQVFPPRRAQSPFVSGSEPVVGMMTAPRGVQMIRQTLQSVHAAGFEHVSVFAEPGSWIPDDMGGFSAHTWPRRLGALGNFYASMTMLLESHPEAETFIMFQDDIEVALGTREWIQRELWPFDTGIASLFTPRPHIGSEPGWKLHTPGYQRVCGAQALAFRRDVLERFLSDPAVLARLQRMLHNDDAVVAGWAAREGLPIAYHSPSVVNHIGEVSSLYEVGPDRRNFADAVSTVHEIAGWRRPRPEAPAKIGLTGWNTPTGLGYQNRDLAEKAGIDRWLIPEHPKIAALDDCVLDAGKVRLVGKEMPGEQLRDWCQGLDWLLFIETPRLPNLVRDAAHLGVGIACIPNWEWLQPESPWLSFVDVMLCPTLHTFALMNDWKARYGFGWRTVYLPWPIDTNRFQFQQRHRCRRFLYVNGWSGSWMRYPDGSPVAYRRKGLDTILETARLAPRLSFVIRTQEPVSGDIPPNVEILGKAAANEELYTIGDVCVQPSRFEGLGLQLLECQAAGLPLVTTDAPPMNEHNPLKTIPTSGFEIVDPGPGPVLSNQIDPATLASVLESLVETDISAASRLAREFVERNHSWDSALRILRQELAIR